MDLLSKAITEIKVSLPQLELREQEPMSAHCSFKIGGPAAALAIPSSPEQTAELCQRLREAGISPLIVGNGTNLLITDEPLQRFVIKLGDRLSSAVQTGERELTADCGISLARLASQSARLGLSGLEFAHGIPGTLGGAVCMNAGAYGGEMKDVLQSVTYLDENCQLLEKSVDRLELSYRHSIFSHSGCVVLRCRLGLVPGEEADISAKMRELAEKRRSSQPLDKPSAGSTFKRPSAGYAAALIDQAGLRGFSIGGAQVSEKHAGFVINTGSASFSDVRRLMEHIQKTVYDRSGIMLEPEVKIIENIRAQ